MSTVNTMSGNLAQKKVVTKRDPKTELLGDRLMEHLEGALFTRQEEDGHWHYCLDDNATLSAEYVMFIRWLDLPMEGRVQQLSRHLISTQNKDGSWSLFYEGPGDISATVESYFALRLAGYDLEHETLVRAREFILEKGGIPNVRVFTKIWLSLFGLFPWAGIPVIPPEIVLAPRKLPFHLNEFSCWSRAVIIPLTVLFHQQKVTPVNFKVDELYCHPRDKEKTKLSPPPPVDDSWIIYSKKWKVPLLKWEYFFIALNRGVGIYETRSPFKPLRKLAVRRALNWILEHQEEAGDWCGIIPAMMNSVMALHASGMKMTEDPIVRGLQAIEEFCRGPSKTLHPHAHEDQSIACLQSTVSPVWDTALTSLALCEAGVDKEDPRMMKAREWLWSKRITRLGDWMPKSLLSKRDMQTKNFMAWCFQYHNDFYPDIDDTTVVTLALSKMGMTNEELAPALHWLKIMQSSDGGWGAFDRDNNEWLLNQIPFADLKSLIDPSSPDVTGHVLETFGELGMTDDRSTKRAIRYLKRTQKKNGSWFGRWGVNSIYGTSAALVGLLKVGQPVEVAYIQKGLRFILNRQNADGGWGEYADSYKTTEIDGMGRSTPSQTAWALLALEACRTVSEDFEFEIHKALEFLDSRKISDGLEEPEYTGTGFPEHFYLRYDGYRTYFPMMALGRLGYRRSFLST